GRVRSRLDITPRPRHERGAREPRRPGNEASMDHLTIEDLLPLVEFAGPRRAPALPRPPPPGAPGATGDARLREPPDAVVPRAGRAADRPARRPRPRA